MISIIDFFIGPSVLSAPKESLLATERLRKTRLTVSLTLSLSILVMLMFFIRYSLETSGSKTLFLLPIVSVVMFSGLFIIKFYNATNIVFWVEALISCLVVFVRTLATGGISSPVVIWLILLPILGVLIVSVRVGVCLLLLCIAQILILTKPQLFGLNVVEMNHLPIVQAMVLIILIAAVSTLVCIYEFQRVMNEKLIRETEKELASSKKLASLGSLSGGLAHEINNPLAILKGQLGIMEKVLKKDKQEDPFLTKKFISINTSLDRIQSVVDAFRTFSRDNYMTGFEEIDLSKCIEEAVSLVDYDGKCEVINEVKQTISVQGNSDLVIRIFVNLLTNSVQAIEGESSSWIKITQQEGAIVFTDSGSGIADDVADQIMDPFFTTKPVGMGTGLGLSLCQNIAHMHGWTLKLNRESKNTEFILELKS